MRLLVLLLLALASSVQSAGEPPGDCSVVQKLYVKQGLPLGDVASRPTTRAQLAVCLGTTSSCCTKAMEQRLGEAATTRVHQSFGEQLRRRLTPLAKHRTSFEAHMKQLLLASWDKMHKMFAKTYGYIYLSHSKLFKQFFEELQRYFQGDIENIGKRIDSFFNVLQERMVPMLVKTTRTNNVLRKCLLRELSLGRPFGDAPQEIKSVLRRSLVTARTFAMVLAHQHDLIQRISDRVLNSLSKDCQNALTRLTQCPICVGSTARPCQQFCQNVMNGCLYQLFDIIPSWQRLNTDMKKLVERMKAPLIIGRSLNSIGVKVSTGIMDFQKRFQSPEERKQLLNKCQAPRRTKREVPPTPRRRNKKGRNRGSKNRGRSSKNRNRGAGRQRGRDAPKGRGRAPKSRGRAPKNRRPQEPQVALEGLIGKIDSKVLTPQGAMWTDLMRAPCSNDARCWNGSAEAPYETRAVASSLSGQVTNPEVVVDTSVTDRTLLDAKALLQRLSNSVRLALFNNEVEWIAPAPPALATKVAGRVAPEWRAEGSGDAAAAPVPLRPAPQQVLRPRAGPVPKPPDMEGSGGTPLPPRPSQPARPPPDDESGRAPVEGSGLAPSAVPTGPAAKPRPSPKAWPTQNRTVSRPPVRPRPRPRPEWNYNRPPLIESSGAGPLPQQRPQPLPERPEERPDNRAQSNNWPRPTQQLRPGPQPGPPTDDADAREGSGSEQISRRLPEGNQGPQPRNWPEPRRATYPSEVWVPKAANPSGRPSPDYKVLPGPSTPSGAASGPSSSPLPLLPCLLLLPLLREIAG